MLARALAVTTLLLALAGCATFDYASLPAGRIEGRLFVMWIDEGNGKGDGTFLFVPDPHAKLTFHRSDRTKPGATITPGMMYTDGGSIPSIAQVFNGFHPWGYAPAYMIHDWLFTARHCLVDKDPDPRFASLSNVTFDDSAEILGEAIQALVKTNQVKKNDLAGSAITTAVDSAVARKLWDAQGSCGDTKVSAQDRADAEAAIPGSATARARYRISPGAPVPSNRRVRIVGQVAIQ